MSQCSVCAASFDCAMVEGSEQACWCGAWPSLAVPDLPATAANAEPACLCPECLRALSERVAARKI
ncbi:MULTISPECIES: cysteine-rich CWC family protein [unclassified Undibacterium]|uniref:cysteine-rich CWC family protein n=1 Tax=unclassified Undibacterium TaxID=2630295 RepID=UPI002AC998FF|nr:MULTISPECIES: cysteine-rich CWC family protein [unclassified Undibacterium]MEB0139949.1 cysteine-rich CWC family protein [Undibacterium sp. CCC2.1]MEB0172922.1 cysteine-rich CWC family protein [Undibacterium sp. CCC1.1]MEB0176749.1 cysteine-rich CWC family protein [Undibacterium sp. CCC3.4]MEB0216676.1 cysteine-rich CWC family protein [Undibacterium sp. 5I2]WPX44988.1 cysteine-rich CWC family protein [Undibacterium sp. CCC3.4]